MQTHIHDQDIKINWINSQIELLPKHTLFREVLIIGYSVKPNRAEKLMLGRKFGVEDVTFA